MLEWLDKLGSKPDHPMHSIEAAQVLLADLPEDPAKALAEVASWLNTLTSTEGFRLADRFSIVKLLDETGQPFEGQLVQLYLKSGALKEFERIHAWQVALEFWEHLSGAYQLCLAECGQNAATAGELADELPLLIARGLRALTNLTRVLHLRYFPVRDEIWQALLDSYRLSETLGCSQRRLAAYTLDVLQTTPRQELLCALMLDAALPESILPRQIDLTARAAARFADLFLFRSQPEPGCNWYVDLARPLHPRHVSANLGVQTTMRFFGAGNALATIDEVIKRMAANPAERIKLLGDDCSSEEKLLVLKRLARYWSVHPPHRREARHQGSVEIQVAQGFKHVASLVPHVESRGMAEIVRGTLDVTSMENPGLRRAVDKESVPTERWLEQNTARWGLCVDIPRESESRVRVGTLCGLNCSSQQWWVGVVRRFYRDSAGRAHAGIEILAKKPVSVWLRGVGPDGALADTWAVASESMDHEHLSAILLDDSAMTAQRHELVLAHGVFHAGNIYEAMAGDTPRYLKFEELLGEGDDFLHVRFTWNQGKSDAIQ